MVDLKKVAIKGYYLTDEVLTRCKDSVHFIKEADEDSFIDIYPVYTENIIVVTYYEDCELSHIDSFYPQEEDVIGYIQKRIERYLEG